MKKFIIGLIILCLSVKFAEMQGFCIKKFAFLSDIYTEQEFINKGIAKAIYNNNKVRGNLDYLSFDEFKKINSKCCQLTSRAGEGYKGSAYGYIEVNYLIRDLYNIPLSTRTNYIAYDSCGDIISD